MATQTHTGTAAGDDGTTGFIPPLPSGDELYDAIMGSIEPELMLDSLPHLAEKYRDETPEQARARAQRYDDAFAAYDKRYEEFALHMETLVHTCQRTALASVEQHSRSEEAVELAALEQSFSSPSAS